MDKKLSIEEIDLLLREGINSEKLFSKEKLSKEEIKKLEDLLKSEENFPLENGDLIL